MINNLRFCVNSSELNMNSYIKEEKFTKEVSRHFSELKVPIYRIKGTLYIGDKISRVANYNGYIIGGKFLEMNRKEFNSYISKIS